MFGSTTANEGLTFITNFNRDYCHQNGWDQIDATHFPSGTVPTTRSAIEAAVRANWNNKFDPAHERTIELHRQLSGGSNNNSNNNNNNATTATTISSTVSTPQDMNTCSWSVSIGVYCYSNNNSDSPLMAHLRSSDAARIDFLRAVNKHIMKLGEDFLSHAKRPDFPAPISPATHAVNEKLVGQQMPHNRKQLFVRDPSTERNTGNNSGSEIKKTDKIGDVDYRLYCGGTDIFGDWHVDPLGALVAACVVAKPATTTTPAQCVVIPIAARNEDHAAQLQSREQAELHSFLRFVAYCNSNNGNNNAFASAVAPLPMPCVTASLAKLTAELGTAELVVNVRDTMLSLTLADTVPPQGLLLHGPPGTGKSATAKILLRHGGFVPTVPAHKIVAAGDFKGMLQGETEQRIRAIFLRSSACPWLQFGVCIDEIETLVANRNQRNAPGGGGGGDSSALGVVLTNFSVPDNNLFLFAATNLRKAIDAAFGRRMSAKIFVGLPGRRVREDFVPILRNGECDTLLKFKPAVREELARLTLNFSGSNMRRLMQILQDRVRIAQLDTNSSNGATASFQPVDVTVKQVLEAVNQVSQEEMVFIAGLSMSRLFERVGATSDDVATANSNSKTLWKWFHSDFGCLWDGVISPKSKQPSTATAAMTASPSPTGRIIIDLSALYTPGGVQGAQAAPSWAVSAPYIDVELQGGTLHTLRPQIVVADSAEKMRAAYTVTKLHFIALLAQMATRGDFSVVRVVDNALFADTNVDDETGMVSLLREEVAQASAYQRSIVVLDLDAALIDVNFEQQQQQQGGNRGAAAATTPHESIHRQELFGEMIAAAQRCALVSPQRMNLIVLVSSYDALLSRARHGLAWPLSNPIQRARNMHQNRDSDPVRCTRCDLMFVPRECEGRYDICRPHPVAARLHTTKPNPKPTELGMKTIDEVRMLPGAEQQGFIWTCCSQPMTVQVCGLNSQAGCHVASAGSNNNRNSNNNTTASGVVSNARHEHVERARADAGRCAPILSNSFQSVWCNICSEAVAPIANNNNNSNNAKPDCQLCDKCGVSLLLTRTFDIRATTCSSCQRHRNLLDGAQDFHLTAAQTRGQFFSLRRGVLTRMDSLTSHILEKECKRNTKSNNNDASSAMIPFVSRFGVPLGAPPPDNLRIRPRLLHLDGAEARAVMPPEFFRLPLAERNASVQLLLACPHPDGTDHCDCRFGMPGAEILCRIIKPVSAYGNARCTVTQCSDTSVMHHLSLDHCIRA